MNSFQTLLALIASSLLFPLLSLLAVVLRRRLVSGTFRFVTLGFAILSLIFVFYHEIHEEGIRLGQNELFTFILVSLLTFVLMARSDHHHSHTNASHHGVHAIVLAEAFHSLFDGLALGTTFLVSPILGFGATLGAIVHEAPKTLATLALFRSSGLSITRTLIYGALCQIGVPLAALFVFLFGTGIEKEFHAADIAVLASLATVILTICYKEMRFHLHERTHHH